MGLHRLDQILRKLNALLRMLVSGEEDKHHRLKENFLFSRKRAWDEVRDEVFIICLLNWIIFGYFINWGWASELKCGSGEASRISCISQRVSKLNWFIFSPWARWLFLRRPTQMRGKWNRDLAWLLVWLAQSPSLLN